jgi:hypothetical protein
MPWVHYGGLYSTFVQFSESEDSQRFLCECSRSAAGSHVIDFCEARGDKPPWPLKYLPGLIEAADPSSMPQEAEFSGPAEVIPQLQFAEGICHRCNLGVPSIDYGYEICFKRTTFFAQRFGFYIQQWLYAQGLSGWGSALPNTPIGVEVQHLLAIDDAATRKLLSECWRARNITGEKPPLSWEEEHELNTALKRQRLSICNHAEQVLRQHFRFPPRGKLAQAEHLLFLIASRIFSPEQILRRARPDWLVGLELDIYIPSLRIAFEYQGHQHENPRSFLHADEESFSRLRDRDDRKRRACAQHNVRLAYFDESDYLTEALVRQRVDRATTS